MKKHWRVSDAISATLLGLYSLMPAAVRAANTVYFSTSDVGTTKSIGQWGVEVVDNSSDNMRQSIANMGANNIGVIATNFFVDQPLQANGQIATSDQSELNIQLGIAAMAGNKPLIMGPNVGSTDSSYLSGNGVSTTQWEKVLDATKSYFNSQGWTVSGAMPFNEPDYWSGQGTQQNLHDIMALMQSDPNMQGVARIGASTLDSDNALSWYNAISGVANYGSTHVLGGSATSYKSFFQQVAADGGSSSAPELHELGEAIYAAEYGAQQGIWWGPALLARGLFVQDSQGKQLGYAENLANDTAAAVYRGPDGSIRAFAGGFERFGASTAYRFVSTDRDVYFNGVGPIRQYMVQVGQGGEAYADIQYGPNPLPPLDGNRWQIVNRSSGQVLQVVGGSTSDGAQVNSGANTGALNQEWNITRNENGYYDLFNANSGLTLDVANGSLANSASIDQYGTADNLVQQWSLQPAGNGYYYIVNGNSDKYLSSNTSNAFQYSNINSLLQQWQFVPANPPVTGTLKAQYKFEGNANDSAGANNATVFGNPTYAAGPTTAEGQAISLNGTNSYVQLPSGVANSSDITISAWVKWNGGNAWQRVFDFGNNTTSYMYLTPDSGDGTMRFAITTGGNTAEQILDTDPLPTGQWVHLAVTLSGDTGVLYVNGVATVAGQITLNPSDINSTLNYIGKSQYNDPLFSGMIDDFRIYNYALNQAQIANLVPISHYSWTGGVNTQWSTATLASPKDWKLTFDGTATDYFDNDTVLFDDSATNFTVNTASNVSPVATTFSNTTTYTFTGAAGITGSGTITKNGAGIVNLNNVNTYTGATTVNSGTLNLNGSLAGSAVTVNGGTFSESSTGTITGNVALTNTGFTILAGVNSLGTIRATGPGVLSITGGTTSTTTNGLVTVGDTASDNAVLNVSSGVLNANQSSAPSLSIGSAAIGAGTMTILGGTVNAASEVWVSSATGSTGTLNVTGGTLNSASWLAIGRGGDNGNLNVTGGNVNVNGANLTIASFGGSIGQATVSGGTITTVNGFYVGEGGTGTLSISGTGKIVTDGTEGLRVGRNGGSSGTVNLNTGGIIQTAAATGGSGTSTFNFNGGILKGNANSASFMSGLGAAYVYSHGAIIDDGGNNITVAQALQAPGGSGVTSIALTTTGLSYVYPPAITISGGTLASGGVPATAVATFNYTTGQVTGITITNPGNYTSTTGLAVSFSGGGGGSPPSVGTIATAANAGGGLTKNGTGTLTLAGVNTYSGATTVNAGTLTLSTTASIASTNVSTAVGATLNAGGVSNGGLPATTALTSNGVTNFAGNIGTSGAAAVTLASITVGADPTSKINFNSSPLHANRTVIITGGLTFSSVAAGQVDLKDNDMIVHQGNSGSVTTAGSIASQLKAGFNPHAGYWNGTTGITSSNAAADSTHLTTLGYHTGGNAFDGVNTSSTDVLVKYTYFGDANLDGVVNGAADYQQIDLGFGLHATGWQNGDFNYDGVVDGADYALIDNAFNQAAVTGASPLAMVVSPVNLNAAPTAAGAVPEPTLVGLVGIRVIGLLGRRRRTRACLKDVAMVTFLKGHRS